VGERVTGDIYIFVKNKPIKIKEQLKYLGLLIDNKWKFTPHIKYVTQKAMGAIETIRGITPNLKGPSANKRRLYATAATSVITYAASIWAIEVKGNPRTSNILNKFDRKIAQRVCRAYKTVSRTAALILAGIIPAVDIALKLKMAYYTYKEQELNSGINYDERKKIGNIALKDVRNGWFD